MAKVSEPPNLAQERYRLLVQQMRDELETQEAVGEVLGMTQAFVSELLRGTRSVGIRTLEQTIRKLRIDRRFFDDPSLRNPRYKDFVGKVDESRVERAKRYPAFERVLEYYPPAQQLTEHDIAALDRLDFGGVDVDEELFELLVRRQVAKNRGKKLESTGEAVKTTPRPGRVKLQERKRG